MKDKLPHVFANKINKNAGNNDSVYHDSYTERKVKDDKLSVNQKINKIFSSSRYVYKADVDITLKNGNKVSKKIIGRNKNQLITMDSELIMISDIADIDFTN